MRSTITKVCPTVVGVLLLALSRPAMAQERRPLLTGLELYGAFGGIQLDPGELNGRLGAAGFPALDRGAFWTSLGETVFLDRVEIGLGSQSLRRSTTTSPTRSVSGVGAHSWIAVGVAPIAVPRSRVTIEGGIGRATYTADAATGTDRAFDGALTGNAPGPSLEVNGWTWRVGLVARQEVVSLGSSLHVDVALRAGYVDNLGAPTWKSAQVVLTNGPASPWRGGSVAISFGLRVGKLGS